MLMASPPVVLVRRRLGSPGRRRSVYCRAPRQPPGGPPVTFRSSHQIPLRRSRGASFAFLVILIALLAGFVPAARPQAAAAKPRIVMYRGLGTWVDMYDAKAWADPATAVADMAAHGVRTLSLETANFHYPTSASVSMFTHGKVTAANFITECHAK